MRQPTGGEPRVQPRASSDPSRIGPGRTRVLRAHQVAEFQLESGEILRDLTQAYFLDGELNERRDNGILLLHPILESADAVGGWWSEIAGPGKVIDTDRYAVLSPNLLGSCFGTSGPAEEGRDAFPAITPRDMARFVQQLLDHLGMGPLVLATGGGLGGMVTMEWAASYPALASAVVIFTAPASHTAHAIGWGHVQRRMISTAGEKGLEIARMLSTLVQRTPEALSHQFGRNLRPDGGYQIEGYLDRQGRELRERFDLRSYLTLLDAMDAHDVGRGRGGPARALRAIRGRLLAVGIPGDGLYSDADVRSWAGKTGAAYREILSGFGHDAYLLENEQVANILSEVLESPLPGPMLRVLR